MADNNRNSRRLFQMGDYWLSTHPTSASYYITWYDPGIGRTTRTTTNTDDLERAKLILADHAQRESVRRSDVREPQEVLIHEVFNYYLDNRLTPGNPSRAPAFFAIARFTEFFKKEDMVFVSELTPDRVDEYVIWRRGHNLHHASNKPVADSTISRELSVLAAALNYMRKRGKITRTPHIQLLSQPPARQRWLTPKEAQRLLDAAGTRLLKDYILLSLHTLQRPKYLYELTVDQVDLARHRIDFAKPDEPITRKRRPVVRISETIRNILIRRMAQSQSGHILEYRGQPIRTSLKKSFKEAARRAGLGENVVPYTLRHTGATWLAQAGVPIREISGMMGHTMQQTTELYAKHSPEFQQNATAALDAILPDVAVQRASYAQVHPVVVDFPRPTPGVKSLIAL